MANGHLYANISRLSTHVTTGIHFEQNLLWISEILNNLFVISGRPKIRSNWKRSQFATNTFYVRLCLRYTVHLNASSIQWKYYTHRENSIFIINNIYLHLQYKNRKTYSNSKCSRSLNLRQTKEEKYWIHKRISCNVCRSALDSFIIQSYPLYVLYLSIMSLLWEWKEDARARQWVLSYKIIVS